YSHTLLLSSPSPSCPHAPPPTPIYTLSLHDALPISLLEEARLTEVGHGLGGLHVLGVVEFGLTGLDPFHRVRTEVPVQIVADEAGDGPSLFAAGGEGKDPCVREGLCGGDQFVPGFGDREVVFLEERLVVPDPLD